MSRCSNPECYFDHLVSAREQRRRHFKPGATNVNAGTLQAGAVNAFSPFSAFTIAGSATLDLNKLNQTIGLLAGAGSWALPTLQPHR